MRRVPAALLTTAALLGGAAMITAGNGSAVTTGDTVAVRPTGSLSVTFRGNGHGHGMSQYGAYGAALAGLSTTKILAHYYPGTTLATAGGNRVLRVKLSGTGSTTVVFPDAGLRVTGVAGNLPTTGISRYRLVADSGSGIALQRLVRKSGATYTTVKSGLPNSARFIRTGRQPVRVGRTDGTSTYYYGGLHAVRAAARGATSVATVDYVSYDRYAAGVAPREMPSGWAKAALAAQAIAARTYAVYEKQHGAGRSYDVCDTTMCQVYGGHQHLSSSGRVLWNDLPTAASSTSNQVLTYRGATIFSQYSASNGGWTVDGGQPYLRAGADPYDPGRTGDPYVNATRKVSASSLAGYYGLARVTRLVISSRDGHGAWGGRVLSAVVYGTDRAGKAAAVHTTGSDLQWAFGLGTTWFSVRSS